ncbi:MAG: glycosyltransferase family 2 protein [Oscillospiraceae bacterium]|nr:glycosyltransferase family 2 protein [Oscillospiraceae bacterium]
MAKITCLTCAYNAEKTLERTIKSLLGQTYTDIKYIVIDHGSTDKTRKIIQEFEKKDNRIHGIYYDKNKGAHAASSYIFENMVSEAVNTQWFAVLDSDDEYKINAFEHMLDFAEKKSLDLVCCGSDFYDYNADKLIGKRIVNNSLVVDTIADFDKLFCYYHIFMRTHWGKLVSSKVISQCDFSWMKYDLYYDTSFSFEALKHANSFGIINESLHIYNYSTSSSSYRMEPSVEGKPELKLMANSRIYDFTCDFLNVKTGHMSDQNYKFMLYVYLNSLLDTLDVYLNADIDNHLRLDLIYEMFSCDPTYNLMSYYNHGTDHELKNKIKRLFVTVNSWLTTLSEIDDNQMENYCSLGEGISNACDDVVTFMFFRRKRIEFYMNTDRMKEAEVLINELKQLYGF